MAQLSPPPPIRLLLPVLPAEAPPGIGGSEAAPPAGRCGWGIREEELPAEAGNPGRREDEAAAVEGAATDEEEETAEVEAAGVAEVLPVAAAVGRSQVLALVCTLT